MNEEQKKSANGDTVNVALMKAMGSKSGASDPIPPTQHEALMDKRETEEIRILGALFSRTIARGHDGTRSAAAREPLTGRFTRDKDLADYLGIAPGNLSSALSRLVEQDKIRIERKPTRIYLRADVPPPDLGVIDEEDEEAKKEKAKKKERKVFQPENYSAEKLEFLARLEDTDPDRFRAAMSRLVAAEVWSAQVFADAQAWARERGGDVRDQVFTESGYTNGETRGRKRKRPATTSDAFKATVSFPQLSEQRREEFDRIASQLSVQNGKVIVNGNKKNSEQKAHPYGPEVQSSESKLASNERVNAKPKTAEAELDRQRARTEIKNEINARLHAAKMTVLGAVKMDAGTLNTLASDLLRLRTAGDVREVLEVLEERAREIKSGKRVVEGWGYVVKTVRGEVEKRLPADLKTGIKTAAAGKGMW